MNSVYVDFLAKLVFAGQVGWGGLFWLGDPHLPLGQPNSLPLMGAIVKPGLWPIWLIVSLGGTLFPFLLCPVYLIFISRVSLAWSLDRQVPEWFGEVNERVRAPLNAILAALGFSILLAAFQNFPLLPKVHRAGDGRLSLVSTIWFGILMARDLDHAGVQRALAPFTRKDLIRNAPWRALGRSASCGSCSPWRPTGGRASSPSSTRSERARPARLTYLNQQGVSFAIGVVVVAIVIYIIQAARNRAAGVDLAMLYREYRRTSVRGYPGGDRAASAWVGAAAEAEEEGRGSPLRRVRLPRLGEGVEEDAERGAARPVQGGRSPLLRRPHRQGDRPHRGERREAEASLLGPRRVARDENELMALENDIAAVGYYPYPTTHAEIDDVANDPAKLADLFDRKITAQVADWMALAADRLEGSDIPVYLIPGNDDPYIIDEALEKSAYCINVDGGIADIPGGSR